MSCALQAQEQVGMAVGRCPNCGGRVFGMATTPKGMKIRQLEAASGDFRRRLVPSSWHMLSKLGDREKANLDKTVYIYIGTEGSAAGRYNA